MLMFDYTCPTCATTRERIVDRPAPDSIPCDCGGTASRRFPAPRLATTWGAAAVRGSSDEAPPWVMDTQPIADGQTVREWRKERRKQRAREIHEEVKRDFGDPRVTIYGGSAS
jgi:hypothetical protein